MVTEVCEFSIPFRTVEYCFAASEIQLNKMPKGPFISDLLIDLWEKIQPKAFTSEVSFTSLRRKLVETELFAASN